MNLGMGCLTGRKDYSTRTCVCVSNFIYIHITYKFHKCTWAQSKCYINAPVFARFIKFCNLVGPRDCKLSMSVVESVYKDARTACEDCTAKKIQLGDMLKKYYAKQ
jgi:hypothetical protein